MHKPESIRENVTCKIFRDFEVQLDLLIPTRRPDLVIFKKKKKSKKRSSLIADFAAPADYSVTIKEKENRDKYLDIVKELKILWNMKVTVIPIVISVLGKIPKGLVRWVEELKIRGRAVIIQTIALLRSARILRKVLET